MKRKGLVGMAFLFGLWIALHLILHRPIRAGYIVAHRGAAGLAPENTLPAIRAGIDSGAAFIEIDVQRSADGVLLLHHDTSIEGHAIAAMAYADIRSLNGEPIPTFDEALSLFSEEAHPDQVLIVEGKSPATYPNIAAEIVAAVDAHGLPDRVLYMSFDEDWLREIHSLAPDAELGSIHVYPFRVPEIERMGMVGMHWPSAVIDPTLIGRLHRRGLDVNVWTLDSPLLVRLMRWLGADAITTNRPDRIR